MFKKLFLWIVCTEKRQLYYALISHNIKTSCQILCRSLLCHKKNKNKTYNSCLNCLNATTYLSMCILLWPQLKLVVMFNSSVIIHHVTKQKLSQTDFMNMAMSSRFFSGLSSHWIQQNTFGRWQNARFAAWKCTLKICRNHYAYMSEWTKISMKCFQHLVEVVYPCDVSGSQVGWNEYSMQRELCVLGC